MAKRQDRLNCFVLVKGDTIISPLLTTTREYGNWLPEVFDDSIASQELFLSTKKTGTSLKESHPGTKIGNYFDHNSFQKDDLKCWYIGSDTDIMKRLIKFGLADLGDCSKYNDRQMLRVYTVEQIQLYIKTKIDRNFDIGNLVLDPKQIMIQDMNDVVKPIQQKRKGLF